MLVFYVKGAQRMKFASLIDKTHCNNTQKKNSVTTGVSARIRQN